MADESWQDMLSNNTGLPSPTDDIYRVFDEDIESCLRTHRGVSHTGADLSDADLREKTLWSVEEVLKLIVGVLSTTPKPGRQKRWHEIVEMYFKGERTEEKLKQKWKDLKKHAIKKTDGEQRLFYMMAAIVEVEIKSDKQNVFENAIQEWYVTSEITDQEKLAHDWLNSVKNMEVEQQLSAIKHHVTVAERSHAYDKIPYWRNPVHP
ncbi:hypothetical protein LOK49_Contig3G00016 [Camellia lanceoleosa]|nr:hypothetical protein LOK49_Contig3G00016 [Camellia lanceoleosa]